MPNTTTDAAERRGVRTPRRHRKSKPNPAAQTFAAATGEPSGAHEAQIRLTAFALYEARGGEAGHEVEDWLRAEAQFDAQAAQAATP